MTRAGLRRGLRPGGPAAAVAVGIGAAAVTLTIGFLKIGRSFNYDESVTYALFIRGGSITKALTTQYVLNNHPLFSAVQALGWRLGFVGETSQRLAPISAGAAVVGLMGWAVARRVGIIGGSAAAIFLLLNPIFVYEFRHIRGYALATLAVVAAALALRRSWHDTSTRWMALQGTAMFVAVATHAYSALALAVLAIVTVTLGHLRRAHVLTWSLAAVVAIALRLPILGYELQQNRQAGRNYQPAFARTLAMELFGRQHLVELCSIAACTAGMVIVARRSTRHAFAIAICTVATSAAVIAIWQIAQPAFLFPRFFISLVPFIAAFVGVGVSRLPPMAGAAVVAVLLLGLWPNAQQVVNDEPPYREGGRILESARFEGLDVCGFRLAPLAAYVSTTRSISSAEDFGNCEVFVSVSLPAALSEAATARFGSKRHIGGSLVVWADETVLDHLVPSD